MKKKALKVLWGFLILIIASQHTVFADSISGVTQYIDFNPTVFMFFLIILSIFIVIILSVFSLHMISKEETKDENKKISKAERKKYFEKKAYLISSLLIVALVLLFIRFSQDMFYFESYAFVIEVLLFLFLIFIIRIFNKKVSNILCIIFIIVFIIASSLVSFKNHAINVKVEEFNAQFLKCISDFSEYELNNTIDPRELSTYSYKIKDVKELIKTIINNNNNNDKKVTLICLNKSYVKQDELENLLKKLDTKINYGVEFKKDEVKHINEIHLFRIRERTHVVESYNSTFTSFLGIQTGSSIKALLGRIISNANTYAEEPDNIPCISYNTTEDRDDENYYNASRIVTINDDGNENVKIGNHSPVGVNVEKLTNDYISFLNDLSKGLDSKHAYSVVMTYNDLGKVAGITINYDKNSNIENFEALYDEKTVNGVASTTGMDIYCEAE